MTIALKQWSQKIYDCWKFINKVWNNVFRQTPRVQINKSDKIGLSKWNNALILILEKLLPFTHLYVKSVLLEDCWTFQCSAAIPFLCKTHSDKISLTTQAMHSEHAHTKKKSVLLCYYTGSRQKYVLTALVNKIWQWKFRKSFCEIATKPWRNSQFRMLQASYGINPDKSL